MKRILFVSPWMWVDGKGSGMPSVYNTLRGYVKNGYEVDFVVGTNKLNDITMMDGITVHEVEIDGIRKDQVFDKNFSYFGVKWNLKERILNKLRWNKSISKYVKSLDTSYDIIYSITPMSAIAMSGIRARLHVWRFMGVNLTETSRSIYQYIFKFPIELLEFKALSNLSKSIKPKIIITDDDTNGDELVKNLKFSYSGFYFKRNGVEDFFDKDEKEGINNKVIFISTCRLVGWKRVDRIIRFSSELKRHIQNFEVHLVGDGLERENLEKLACELGVTDVVKFVGAVKRPELKYYLNNADFYLCFLDYGQLGNSLYEAMSTGIVPVVYNTGKVSSYFSDEAILVNDYKEAVDKINGLNNETIRSLKNKARNKIRKEHGTWEGRIDDEVKFVEND
ncbi:glycosyltransferase family 4 protein [Vibrio breoganii]|uniref:glycosyltransferase family 4 protein n=1 Tax=Vibrio breoganii TaxID=553239 RepID=UPI000C864898|nr:glycosyltransferase family 4 protein [Vibrio breoganii]PML85244.1 hypothetical protein BCT68_07890 [Vibrio breoganii]